MYQRLAWHKHSNNPQKKYQSTPITKSICSHPHPHIHDLLCPITIFSQLSPCASWTSTPTSSSSIPFRSSKPYTYSAPKVASELSEHISKKTRFCIHTHLNAPCSGVCIWSASCASHESSFKLQKPKWTCKCCLLGLKIHVCLRNC